MELEGRGEGSKGYVAFLRKHRGKTVNPSTVRRHFLKMNLPAHKQSKKPLLNDRMKAERLEFCRRELGRDDWRAVMWCDESDFFAEQRPHFVRAPPGATPSVATIKHPPKVHVWACICGEGPGKLFLFEENLKKELCEDIIRKQLLPSFRWLLEKPWVLQQDRDPKHTSCLCRQALVDLDIEFLQQPPNSPDLNPIENFWDILKMATESALLAGSRKPSSRSGAKWVWTSYFASGRQHAPTPPAVHRP